MLVVVVPDMGMYKIDTARLALACSPKLSAFKRFVEGAEMFLFPTSDEQRIPLECRFVMPMF